MDPDLDPGGPKTCGSGGSGSGSATLPESQSDRKESGNYQKSWNDRMDPCANILAEGLFISEKGNADLIIDFVEFS